jgi:hypothetical protein
MDSLDWTLTGEEAEEFIRKMNAPKERRPLLTGHDHDPKEVHKRVVELARQRKKEWDEKQKAKTEERCGTVGSAD